MRDFTNASHHARILVAVVVSLTVAACGGGDQPVEPPSAYPLTLDVFTPGNVFSPPTAEIARGGTIRFLMSEAPDGDGHNAIFNKSVNGAPLDIPVVKDTVVSRTFNTVGNFSYLCTVHPGMVGEVIVH
jgi:plastocyanin